MGAHRFFREVDSTQPHVACLTSSRLAGRSSSRLIIMNTLTAKNLSGCMSNLGITEIDATMTQVDDRLGTPNFREILMKLSRYDVRFHRFCPK